MIGVAFFEGTARLVRVFAAAVFAFLMLPILAIVPLSFTSGAELVYPVPGFSLRWYDDFFSRPEWLGSIRNSLVVGLGASLLATLIGTAVALGLRRLPRRVQTLAGALILLPMTIPIVVVAVALFFFYAFVGLGGTFTGLILSHTTIALPFVFISVRASLAGLNPDFLRAAANLGAPPFRAFRRVLLPLIMPGVVTGGLFAFATSLDDVVVAMFVAGPDQLTLPRQMFAGVRENISPTILAAATLLVLLSVLLMVATNLLSSRSRRYQAAAVSG